MTINDFKDRIVDSLEAYDKKIDKLKMRSRSMGKRQIRSMRIWTPCAAAICLYWASNSGITPTPDASTA